LRVDVVVTLRPNAGSAGLFADASSVPPGDGPAASWVDVGAAFFRVDVEAPASRPDAGVTA
jgi:hypothetical protein